MHPFSQSYERSHARGLRTRPFHVQLLASTPATLGGRPGTITRCRTDEQARKKARAYVERHPAALVRIVDTRAQRSSDGARRPRRLPFPRFPNAEA